MYGCGTLTLLRLLPPPCGGCLLGVGVTDTRQGLEVVLGGAVDIQRCLVYGRGWPCRTSQPAPWAGPAPGWLRMLRRTRGRSEVPLDGSCGSSSAPDGTSSTLPSTRRLGQGPARSPGSGAQ